MISSRQIQEVKASSDILAILEPLVKVRPTGRSYSGLCPFHTEKTPSFSISPSRQMWKCFGCGLTGDVFDFLERHQGLSFPDAVRYVAQCCNIELTEDRDPNEKTYELLEQWNLAFRDELKNFPPALAYLEGRGLSRDEIRDHELGFCPWRRPEDAALIGYDHARDLKNAGMLSAGSSLLFCQRITFPIRNESGSLCGFSARTIQALPASHKYINSGHSDVFQKERLLYGFKMARSSASLKGEMNVVEGQMDAIAFRRTGRTNVTAPCGTAFTEHHARLIKKVARKVIFWFDGDAAGRKAMLRAAEICLQEGLDSEIHLLPEKEDIYSFITAGGLLNAIPASPITTLFEHDNTASTVGVLSKIDAALDFLAKIKDPMAQSLELRNISNTFGVSYRDLHARLSRINQKSNEHGKSVLRPSVLGRSHQGLRGNPFTF